MTSLSPNPTSNDEPKRLGWPGRMGFWTDVQLSLFRASIQFLCLGFAVFWLVVVAGLGLQLSGEGHWRFWRSLHELNGASLFLIFGMLIVGGAILWVGERWGTKRRIQALHEADRAPSFATAARYVFWRDLSRSCYFFLLAGVLGLTCIVISTRVMTALGEEDLLTGGGTPVEAQVVRSWTENRHSEGERWTEYWLEYRFLPERAANENGDVAGKVEIFRSDWERARHDGTLLVFYDPLNPGRHVAADAADGLSPGFFLGFGLLVMCMIYPIWTAVAPAVRRTFKG